MIGGRHAVVLFDTGYFFLQSRCILGSVRELSFPLGVRVCVNGQIVDETVDKIDSRAFALSVNQPLLFAALAVKLVICDQPATETAKSAIAPRRTK